MKVVELRIVTVRYYDSDPQPAKPVRPIYTTTGVELREHLGLAKVTTDAIERALAKVGT